MTTQRNNLIVSPKTKTTLGPVLEVHVSHQLTTSL